MYVYQDFSKADKKKLQPLLQLAVQREILNFSKEMLPMHKALVEKEHEDIRVPFWEMFKKFEDFRKHITRTYDGYSHRDIPLKIAAAIYNGDLKMQDIADFSTEGQQKLKEMVERMR